MHQVKMQRQEDAGISSVNALDQISFRPLKVGSQADKAAQRNVYSGISQLLSF